MPELPEVEAARRAIQLTCINKKINRSIIADDTKVIDGVSQSDFQSSLSGKTIVAAHRKGKNLWLELDSPPFPSFQFGMTGTVYIKGIAVTQYKRSAVKEDEEWPSKYSKVFIELDDGLELSFTDKRRFAKVRLLNDPASVPPISELGPDALLEPMKSNEFAEALSKKKTAIKTLLLDQSFISGIGNWVADEVLYQARIHPMQIASSLSKESCEALHASIKEVIECAVEVDADSNSFPIEWLFHFRWGKKSGKVNGKKIEFITVGSRTSAFVPELQKLTGGQIEKKARKSKAAKKESEEDEASESEEEENEKPKSKKKASAKKPSKNAEEDKTQKSAKGGAKKKKIEEIEEPSENVEEDKTQKSAKGGAKKKKIEEIEEPSENVEEDKTQKSAKRGAKKKKIEEIEEPSESVEEEKTQKSAKRGAKKKRIEDIKEPSESAEEEMTQKSAKRGAKKKRIEDIEEPSKNVEEEKTQKSAKRGANKKKIEDGNGGSNQKKKTKK